ncbi:uncharacterized protein LOC110821300 [Carica papaya]|uniref:uncharacterized protein LOC110821300 n=1 Tax=Carica papaya TaxID=3649 RepID=UPI000B8CE793|nr:uncharacterized protein LOC110821300 [Carica papaya]
MKNRGPRDGERNSRTNFSKSIRMKKKNIQRLGGGGLSLEAFANAKSTNSHYNPALLSKNFDLFYLIPLCLLLGKFRWRVSVAFYLSELSGIREYCLGLISDACKGQKIRETSLKDLYERTRRGEKARIEKEAIFQAKREKREKAEAQRKATREKMFKKTRFGQPVMKYRIEHLLQSIQNSN